MRKRVTVVASLVALAALPMIGQAADTAAFAGMTCSKLTDEQLADVSKAYGEPAGVYVAAVEPESLAGKTGVTAGDVLMAVRLTDETDYYPIPARFSDFARFCDKYKPDETMRLLLLRKTEGQYQKVKCLLGKPIGTPVPEDMTAAGAPKPEATPACNANPGFVSTEPEKVLSKTAQGAQLLQRDVDIYGGILAWAFGVRLTEEQKKVVADTLIEDWKANTPEGVYSFLAVVRAAPLIIPSMTPQDRELNRQRFQSEFLQKATAAPDRALSRVIKQISTAARAVLAGEGTANELTQQDVDALIEYLCFQEQMATGKLIALTAEQHAELTRKAVEYFTKAPEEQKKLLANMDAVWGTIRTAWALAQQQQQQALLQQWQQAYQRQAAANANPYLSTWGAAPAAGGAVAAGTPRREMDDDQFNTVMNVLNNNHYSNMNAISNMAGSTSSAYDGAGNWLYNY